jgi:hypothetical protein
MSYDIDRYFYNVPDLGEHDRFFRDEPGFSRDYDVQQEGRNEEVSRSSREFPANLAAGARGARNAMCNKTRVLQVGRLTRRSEHSWDVGEQVASNR